MEKLCRPALDFPNQPSGAVGCATGAIIRQLEGTARGWGRWYSAGWKKAASSIGDQTIRIWNVNQRNCLGRAVRHRQKLCGGLATRWQNIGERPRRMIGYVSGDSPSPMPISANISIPATNTYDWHFSSTAAPSCAGLPGPLTQWTGEDFRRIHRCEWRRTLIQTVFSQDGRLLRSPGPMAIFQVWDTAQGILLHPNDQHAWPRVAGNPFLRKAGS